MKYKWVLTTAMLATSSAAVALDSVELLPPHVNSPSVRMGFLTGVDARYNGNGDLMTLTDIHAMEFNVQTLSRIEPRVNDLVNALNSFGSGHLGDQLSLGQLKIKTSPTIRYTALVHGWGLTENWTVGVGLPAMNYQNHISVESQGSNLAAYRQQFGNGQISPAVDNAFNQLDINLPGALADELAKKGYRPLEDRNESLWGDLQLASLYRFFQDRDWTFVHKGLLILPTGKKADPNDLASLDTFGETAIENNLIAAYSPKSWLAVNGRLGYHYPLPDHVDKRVPLNADDALPGPEGLENVNRKLGETWILGGSMNFKFSQSWSFGLGYEFDKKSSDSYSGSSGRDYDALSLGTNAEAQKSRLDLSYSTVASYFNKTAAIPSIFALEVNDTFAGKNIPRQTLTELTFMLFY